MADANPINISHIDHIVLRVNDLAKMIAFYQGVLGCRLERGPGKNGLAQLRAGLSLIDLVDVNSSLGQQGGQKPNSNAPNMDHVCFQVQPWDTDIIRAHLERYAIEVGDVAPRYGATGMGPSMYLSDPEGNTIELKGTVLSGHLA